MTPARMLRAAYQLRTAAESLKLGHGMWIGDELEWPTGALADDNDRQAQADAEEMLALADDLTTLATAAQVPHA